MSKKNKRNKPTGISLFLEYYSSTLTDLDWKAFEELLPGFSEPDSIDFSKVKYFTYIMKAPKTDTKEYEWAFLESSSSIPSLNKKNRILFICGLSIYFERLNGGICNITSDYCLYALNTFSSMEYKEDEIHFLGLLTYLFENTNPKNKEHNLFILITISYIKIMHNEKITYEYWKRTSMDIINNAMHVGDLTDSAYGTSGWNKIGSILFSHKRISKYEEDNFLNFHTSDDAWDFPFKNK